MSKLILTRRPGESVKIGDSLVLTIREVHPKKVFVQPRDGFAFWLILNQVVELPAAACTLTVAAISGRQVRLHFEADKSVKIMRTELL